MTTLLNTNRLTVSVKVCGWCLWHASLEAGCLVVQVGPVVLEWSE